MRVLPTFASEHRRTITVVTLTIMATVFLCLAVGVWLLSNGPQSVTGESNSSQFVSRIFAVLLGIVGAVFGYAAIAIFLRG